MRAHLRPQVEIAVHRQHRVGVVLGAERKQPLARVLEVLLQEQVSWRGQEKVLAVRGADVLRGSH